MPKKGNIVSVITNVAIFILLEVASLHILAANSSVQNFFFAKWIHEFEGAVWSKTEAVRFYFSLNRENRKLAEENFVLRKELMSLRSQMETTGAIRLTDSLRAASSGTQFSYYPGTIVKISSNTQHNFIILGQGEVDGIKPKSGIITDKGVVGIVDAVGKHYSYAMSFMNTGISISARLGKEGALGPLSWDGHSKDCALLREIPLQYKMTPGDTVYTSGYSSIFPPDIPLGVTGEHKTINGATYEIKVRLFENFNALRYVTIVNNEDEAELEALERQAIKEKKGKKK